MFHFYTFEQFKNYPTLLHAVTTKSNNLPHHFSLALHTGEEVQNILSNRKLLSKLLDEQLPLTYIVANQTHSDHIAVINKNQTKGWHGLKDAVEDCDALITNLKGVALCILTADCVPILLYDKEKEVIAAIHAGWKGTQKRIVFKTIQRMIDVFGSDPKEIIAGIAPSIGVCCYEVGEEVAEHFFTSPEACISKGEKYMLDLPLINQNQLLEAGVQEENIHMSHTCTACNTEQYFSYREENGCSGRFMSIIAMREQM